jgi:hypothetical protein
MKRKTNRQVLTEAIKNLSDFEIIILRERILESVDLVIANQDKVREGMSNHFINADLYINTCQIIKDQVDFND